MEVFNPRCSSMRAATRWANYARQKISVLLGNGDGSLQPFVHYFGIVNPELLAVADFDQDGNLDLAVTSSEFNFINAGALNIMRGNGDGTFQKPVAFGIAFGFSSPPFLLADDLNHDGAPDIVTVGGGGATVFLNTSF